MSKHVPFYKQPFPRTYGIAATVVFFAIILVGIGLVYAILQGKTRVDRPGWVPVTQEPVSTTTASMAPRLLDGRIVPVDQRALRPWAFMIDNQIDARPQLGLTDASVVIEAPVEGGITRLLAIFDPMTTSTAIGPVRSARPYFVEWAEGWKAVYGHVGGSQEALERLAKTPSSTLLDVNEMVKASGFWRDPARVSPHQVLTSGARFTSFLGANATSTARFSSWRYTSEVATSSTQVDMLSVRIPYGGSYTTRWTFEPERGLYKRTQSGKALSTQSIYATNIVVIKTDATILDAVGRLKLRTTGSGDAVIYRDGKKIVGRWRRSAGEVMSFVGTDGADLELRAGTTWIQVTTDDRVFAGLDAE